jgi:hypothetical protein
LTWQKLSANKGIRPLSLKDGRQTSIEPGNTIMDQGFLAGLMLDSHDSAIGSIAPDTLVSETPKVYAAGNILGFVFVLDVTDRTGAPGSLTITDASSARTYKAKSQDGRLVGVVWCTEQEPVVNYDPTNGLTTTLSGEDALVNFNGGNFTFDATGLTGEIYPIIPHRGFVDGLFHAIGDSSYSFDDFVTDLIASIKNIN